MDGAKLLIPYTAKLLSGKTFVVFAVFQPIAKVFPLNHLLYTVHDGHGLMHRESFSVNSVFCAQPQKFSYSKVLLYMVHENFSLFAVTFSGHAGTPTLQQHVRTYQEGGPQLLKILCKIVQC